jgi:hypothetical protein
MVPWRRLGAEFLVIVTGVMAALAADRWASNRDEAKQQRFHLQQLESNFIDNRTIAVEAVQVKRDYEHAAASVLDAVTGRRDASRTVPLPVDVELAGWNHEPHYLSDAWQELVSTGKVELVRNPELRIAVARFYQQVAAKHDLEQEWRTYIMSYRGSVTSVLDPYLRIRILELYPKSMVEDSLGRRIADAALMTRLRGLPDVPGKLADVVMVNRTAAFFAEGDLRGIDEILALIRKELKTD